MSTFFKIEVWKILNFQMRRLFNFRTRTFFMSQVRIILESSAKTFSESQVTYIFESWVKTLLNPKWEPSWIMCGSLFQILRKNLFWINCFIQALIRFFLLSLQCMYIFKCKATFLNSLVFYKVNQLTGLLVMGTLLIKWLILAVQIRHITTTLDCLLSI